MRSAEEVLSESLWKRARHYTAVGDGRWLATHQGVLLLVSFPSPYTFPWLPFLALRCFCGNQRICPRCDGLFESYLDAKFHCLNSRGSGFYHGRCSSWHSKDTYTKCKFRKEGAWYYCCKRAHQAWRPDSLFQGFDTKSKFLSLHACDSNHESILF